MWLIAFAHEAERRKPHQIVRLPCINLSMSASTARGFEHSSARHFALKRHRNFEKIGGSFVNTSIFFIHISTFNMMTMLFFLLFAREYNRSMKLYTYMSAFLDYRVLLLTFCLVVRNPPTSKLLTLSH